MSRHFNRIKLSRIGYYTDPPVDYLNSVTTAECCQLLSNGLTVGRESYGFVHFEGPLNIDNMDLDEIVHFGRGEVTVYPENSPPRGEGLNRPATVVLEGLWPDRATGEIITQTDRLVQLRFAEKAKHAIQKAGGKFVDYCAETGSMVFKVFHFSKYDLAEEDIEDDLPLPPKQLKPPQIDVMQQQQPKEPPKLPIQEMGLSEDDELMADAEIERADFFGIDDITEPEDMKAISPVTHRLADAVGTTPQRLQLMKASFFSEEMEYAQEESDIPKLPVEFLFRSQAKRKAEFYEDMPPLLRKGQAKPVIESAIVDNLEKFPLIKSAEVTVPQRAVTRTKSCASFPMKESFAFRRNCLAADAGSFFGRSFRAGWGPNWVFNHAGAPVGATAEDEEAGFLYSTRASGRSTEFSVKHEELNIGWARSETDLRETNLASLEAQRNHSQVNVEGGCPLICPRPGVAGLADHVNRESDMYETQIWLLSAALWGLLNENEEWTDYQEQAARRESVSIWLAKVCASQIDNVQCAPNENGHLPFVFYLLTARETHKAAMLAQRKGDHFLALLISQAGGSNHVRQLAHAQLESWKEVRADRYVDPWRLRILCLLSGIPVWSGTDRLINTCEGLTWEQAFAVHLWYMIPAVASIPTALKEYEKAFKGKTPYGKYAEAPEPRYKPEAQEGVLPARDINYHLLKLFSKRSHRMERLLTPTTHTPHLLDYRISWLLLQNLESIGYSHMPECRRDSLHMMYASQLESMGLWQWAVFVALHIPARNRRSAAVKGILQRHALLSPSLDERERFLLEDLQVPETWLYSAKAWKARSCGKVEEEAWFLLKAQLWRESHDFVIKHIAPGAVINDRFDFLRKYLDPMAGKGICSLIPGWNQGGKVFLDYMDVNESLSRVVKCPGMATSTYELEKMQPQLVKLCTSICELKADTAKERLCQSEMAKQMAVFLRAILSIKMASKGCSIIPSKALQEQLPELPLPEDYMLQELQVWLRSYLQEVVVTEFS